VLVIAALAAGFALGSVPFGYLLVRSVGRGDIRVVGSGNIGATNVGRLLGPRGWIATLVLDGGKGVAGVALGGWLSGGEPAGLAAGAAGAVLGHCYTPWLGGRGGKGVATLLGAFGFLAPVATLMAAAAFALTAVVTRWVSLGSLVAVIALVIATVARREPLPYTYAAAVVCVVVFLRHRENIQRLLNGTEAKIGGAERD
jgi:glycerol-3-phosphate acyltransferase PlsY